MRVFACAFTLWVIFFVCDIHALMSRRTVRSSVQQLRLSSRKYRIINTHRNRNPSLGSIPDGSIYPQGGTNPCIIKVVGVGGGGGNAVDRMLEQGMSDIDFWSVNTDSQALGRSKAKGAKILTIGSKGLGAGGDAEVGRAAAEEMRAEIAEVVKGADLCFVTAGMGGGTGSGAAPVVAELAKESGALTVGIVTTPFSFEGKRRMDSARAAIVEMRKNVDAIIIISNTKLLTIIPEDTPMSEAFLVADDILKEGVAGISEIIINPGVINIDFADVQSVLSNAGTAILGVGMATGKNRALEAAKKAIECPLLDSKEVENATGLLVNIAGNKNLPVNEVREAVGELERLIHNDANLIVGTSEDESLGDDIAVTVIATGFEIDGEATSAVALNKDKNKNLEGRNRGGKLTDTTRSSTLNLSRESLDEKSEPIPENDTDDLPSFLRSLKKKR